jgi:hypothetical protein
VWTMRPAKHSILPTAWIVGLPNLCSGVKPTELALHKRSPDDDGDQNKNEIARSLCTRFCCKCVVMFLKYTRRHVDIFVVVAVICP